MRTILVVDDLRMSREPLARLLRSKGYRAVCASDGLEAMSTLKAHAPDLVLLDLKMPNLNGIGFLRQLRRDSWWKDTSVIVFTGAMDDFELQQARALGVKDVVTKPGLDRLMNSIETCMSV